MINVKQIKKKKNNNQNVALSDWRLPIGNRRPDTGCIVPCNVSIATFTYIINNNPQKNMLNAAKKNTSFYYAV